LNFQVGDREEKPKGVARPMIAFRKKREALESKKAKELSFAPGKSKKRERENKKGKERYKKWCQFGRYLGGESLEGRGDKVDHREEGKPLTQRENWRGGQKGGKKNKTQAWKREKSRGARREGKRERRTSQFKQTRAKGKGTATP